MSDLPPDPAEPHDASDDEGVPPELLELHQLNEWNAAVQDEEG